MLKVDSVPTWLEIPRLQAREIWVFTRKEVAQSGKKVEDFIEEKFNKPKFVYYDAALRAYYIGLD